MADLAHSDEASAWRVAEQSSMPSAGEDSFRSANLSGRDFSQQDLSGRDFSYANLEGANFEGANLSGARMHRAKISEAEFLMADLTGTDLSDAVGKNAGFAHAKLHGSTLFSANLSGCSFASASLIGADLRAAVVQGARFTDADFTGANLTRTDLRDADLSGASVHEARFEEADLRGASVKRMQKYESASWLGTDTMNVDFCGAYAMRRFIADQNYLHEFRCKSQWNDLVYRAWWLTSNCGRSLFRWSIFTMLLAVVFGLGYQLVGVPFGPNETVLSPFYFSVVTLTTLGFGDVLPVTIVQQGLVMAEVSTGYLMLGGLISIFANKMARRAD